MEEKLIRGVKGCFYNERGAKLFSPEENFRFSESIKKEIMNNSPLGLVYNDFSLQSPGEIFEEISSKYSPIDAPLLYSIDQGNQNIIQGIVVYEERSQL